MDRVLNKYTYIIFAMLFMHILCVTVDGVLNLVDYTLILFILTMELADDDNYLWLAMIFGFFSDFIRDGFYGPDVALFILFYLVRFRSEVIMDMTKMHYRVMLFSAMSYVFCFMNLLITDYPVNTALYLALIRTVINIAIVFIVLSFFKGLRRAVKKA